MVVVGRSLFNPPPPARHYLPLDKYNCVRFWKALRLLVLVAAIGAAIFLSPFEKGLPEPILLLARALYSTLLVISLIRVIWLAFTLQSIQGVGLFRPLVTLALIIGLIAEWAGFRNLSEYLVLGISSSLFGIGLAWLAGRLIADIFDGLDEGRYAWEKQLRQRLGIAEGQGVPGLIWLRIFATIIIWGGLILILLRIWGQSVKGQEIFLRYMTEGFQLGPMHVVPSKMAFALALFTVLLSLASWLRKQLDQRWLRKTRIDHGAREAAITITGYATTAIVLIIALGIAGLDFKNLAIIAGALSVGIGFGLQNVVNNFVSGLILLFERPIRTGDWIVVGTTEGFVKRISIRSTQIQTFDYADVIVPNSELISGQVTNWMLRDFRGRVRIPVGVAYGTDTSKVKEILLNITNHHDMIIKDGSITKPHVLFLGFGDSSLNFEMRFFIRNIERRLHILSDINFEIDAAFREAGIEIPFPQRDLHMRSWSVNGKPPLTPSDDKDKPAPRE